MNHKNPLSFHLNADCFIPATEEERQSLVHMRPSVSFLKDAMRRLLKNPVAMVSLAVILVVVFFSFIVPGFYPYKYEQQIRGSEYLKPMTYSETDYI